MMAQIGQQQAYVAKYRGELLNKLKTNSDVGDTISQLLCCDCDLGQRYGILTMAGLIQENSQSFEQLKKFGMALNILEKYCRHLLKPPEIRSQMWRYVKFTNNIFRDRIDIIKGGRNIMKLMGYTENIKDGLAFPANSVTDDQTLIQLLADILIGKRELDAFLVNEHPNPKSVVVLLPTNTINDVTILQLQLSRQLKNDKEKKQQGYSIQQYLQQDDQSDPRPIQPENMSESKESNRNIPTMSNTNYVPSAYGYVEGSSSNFEMNPENQQQQRSSYVEAPYTLGQGQTRTSLGTNSGTMNTQGSNQQLISDTNNSNTTEKQGLDKVESIVCDICGDSTAEFVCDICDNKQLCTTCDDRWHQHPKRINHERKNIHKLNTEQNTSDETSDVFVTPKEHISPTPSHVMTQEALSRAHSYVTPQDHLAPGPTQVPLQEYLAPPKGHLTPFSHEYVNTKHLSGLQSEGVMNRTGENASFVQRDPDVLGSDTSKNKLPPSLTVGYQMPQNQATLVQVMPPTSSPHLMSQSSMPSYPVIQSMSPSPQAGSITPPFNQPKPAPGGPPTSKLLSGIMAIPDLNKRKSKIDIQLMMLQEEIDVVEEKIQDLIAKNPTFYEDDEYSMLFRKKGMLQREKMQLEKYAKELDDMFDQNVKYEGAKNLQQGTPNQGDILHQQIFYPPTYVPMSYPQSVATPALSIPLGQQQQLTPGNVSKPGLAYYIIPSSSSQPVSHQVLVQSPPVNSDLQGQGYLCSIPLPAGHSYQLPNPNPSHNQPAVQNPGGHRYMIQNQVQGHGMPCTSPGMRIHGPQIQIPPGQISLNIPPEVEQEPKISNVQQQYPHVQSHPNMQMHPKVQSYPNVRPPPNVQVHPKVQSHPNIQSHPNVQMPPNVQSPPNAAVNMRYQEQSNTNHQVQKFYNQPQKSYFTGQNQNQPQNQVNKHSRFQNNPAGIQTNIQNPPSQAAVPEPANLLRSDIATDLTSNKEAKRRSDGYGMPWICQHCTYHNSPDTRVCEVCFKTSISPKFLSDEKPLRTNDQLTKSSAPAAAVAVIRDEDMSNTSQQTKDEETEVLEMASSAAKRLQENYDQVYLEKQEAHRKYQEQLEREELQKQSQNQAGRVSPQTKKQPLSVSPNQNQNTSKHLLPSATPPNQASQTKASELEGNKNLPSAAVAIQKKKQEGTAHSPKSFITPTGSPGSFKSPSGSPSNKPVLNFSETLEKINQKRQQDMMSIEGREVIQLLKTAEKDGFTTDETEIALNECGKDNLTPIAWLKEKWQPMLERVATLTKDEGVKMDQNEIGELSTLEARKALKDGGGDIDTAVRSCVESRQKMYREISQVDNFPREEILHAMLQGQGDIEIALDELNAGRLQQYLDRLWLFDEIPGDLGEENQEAQEAQQRAQAMAVVHDVCNSVTNSVLTHTSFQQQVQDTALDKDRRIRMIMVEGKLQSWGRAVTVIRILDHDVASQDLEATLEEIVEAVKNCGDRQSSLVYLKQECEICFSLFPMSKIRSLNCPCKICVDCMKSYFEIAIRERHVRNLSCPCCSHPDMENTEAASEYLSFLTMMLGTMVSPEILDLFETKIRDWHLQKDPNFRWCTYCGGGFIYQDHNLAMRCPHCQRQTCFKCKKQWEDQHEGLTCEQFEQWKIDNDPENQTIGLAAHLEANGIDCPSCKMRYSLAKGGCMHFKCPECGHEFCSGCSQPFFSMKGMCTKFKSCKTKGLHCHHPRDCFYYLRDSDVEQLQTLITNKGINYNIETAPNQVDAHHCPVMEQKDAVDKKQDEACGKDVAEGQAGLCLVHYKEYLVGIINRNKIDPIDIMTVEELVRLIERQEKTPPKMKQNVQVQQYQQKLIQYVKEKIPLLR